MKLKSIFAITCGVAVLFSGNITVCMEVSDSIPGICSNSVGGEPLVHRCNNSRVSNTDDSGYVNCVLVSGKDGEVSESCISVVQLNEKCQKSSSFSTEFCVEEEEIEDETPSYEGKKVFIYDYNRDFITWKTEKYDSFYKILQTCNLNKVAAELLMERLLLGSYTKQDIPDFLIKFVPVKQYDALFTVLNQDNFFEKIKNFEYILRLYEILDAVSNLCNKVKQAYVHDNCMGSYMGFFIDNAKGYLKKSEGALHNLYRTLYRSSCPNVDVISDILKDIGKASFIILDELETAEGFEELEMPEGVDESELVGLLEGFDRIETFKWTEKLDTVNEPDKCGVLKALERLEQSEESDDMWPSYDVVKTYLEVKRKILRFQALVDDGKLSFLPIEEKTENISDLPSSFFD